jgi:hypothetical protein
MLGTGRKFFSYVEKVLTSPIRLSFFVDFVA